MTVEYVVTKDTGQRFCVVLPLGTPYEVREEDLSVEIAAITL